MKSKEYDGIFKSTFLFAFVQVCTIAVKMILNKIVAVTMGAEGVGLVGIYTSVIDVIKTGAGLGVSQSSVRTIAEVNQKADSPSKTISVVNKTVLLTSLLGVLVTILFSPVLSQWFFESEEYTFEFIAVSLAVGLIILLEGQLGVLKGLRRLRFLAKANIFGSLAGILISVPLYLIYKEQGIVPVLIVAPLISFLFAYYYVKKINYKRYKVTFNEFWQVSSPILKTGVVLSVAVFLSQISTFILSVYISSNGGIKTLGLYNAGIMIMVGYFSVVINALTTDYYPRISAVNTDNIKLQKELNQQSNVSLVIAFPLVIIFLFALPLLIVFLYSKEFLPIIDFIQIGIYGVLLTIFSNQIDLILVAKNNMRVFIITAFFYVSIEVLVSVFLYSHYNLVGLGVAKLITGIIHFVMMAIIVNKLYGIKLETNFVRIALAILLFILLINLGSEFTEHVFIKYGVGGVGVLVSCMFSYFYSKKYLHFDLLTVFKRKD